MYFLIYASFEPLLINTHHALSIPKLSTLFFFNIMQLSTSKLSEKFKKLHQKSNISRVSCSVDQNKQNDVLIENSRTTLAYWNFNFIFEFLRQFASGCWYYLSNEVSIILKYRKNILNFWFGTLHAVPSWSVLIVYVNMPYGEHQISSPQLRFVKSVYKLQNVML